MIDRVGKTPDDIAEVMGERLDDPSKRAQSKPEDDEVAREFRYGYGLLCVIPFAYEYGFDFLIPPLLLWGVMQVVSAWKVELRLWHGHLPTTVGWVVAGLGSAWGFAILVT
ncbi:MAG: hypothetical protein HOP03_02325 [Lysobacter sp.]|nr:hypothetical protein [Lysobacter sp.]